MSHLIPRSIPPLRLVTRTIIIIQVTREAAVGPEITVQAEVQGEGTDLKTIMITLTNTEKCQMNIHIATRVMAEAVDPNRGVTVRSIQRNLYKVIEKHILRRTRETIIAEDVLWKGTRKDQTENILSINKERRQRIGTVKGRTKTKEIGLEKDTNNIILVKGEETRKPTVKGLTRVVRVHNICPGANGKVITIQKRMHLITTEAGIIAGAKMIVIMRATELAPLVSTGKLKTNGQAGLRGHRPTIAIAKICLMTSLPSNT